MTIETSYQKVHGAPVRVGIWTIIQLAAPDRAFILLLPYSALAAGYTNLLPPLPKDLKNRRWPAPAHPRPGAEDHDRD